MNGPNDCWVDKKGGIYFSDPYYQRDYWERKNLICPKKIFTTCHPALNSPLW
jgi:gluconolactonase (EC 3.1.1.17)